MKKTWASAKVIRTEGKKRTDAMKFHPDSGDSSPEREEHTLHIYKSWLDWFQQREPEAKFHIEIKVVYRT